MYKEIQKIFSFESKGEDACEYGFDLKGLAFAEMMN